MHSKYSLLCLIGFFTLNAFAQSELTLSKFRFQKHRAAGFERLVFEFSGPAVEEELEMKENSSGSSGSSKDMSLIMNKVNLVGNIPESKMNESYRSKSEFVGPVSFNTASPKEGFSLRTLIKNKSYEVDAFWLANPTRLTVDVFPKSSPRASSRTVLENTRSLASVETEKKTNKKHKAHHSPKTEATAKPERKKADETPEVFCFPSDSQVSAKVGFQSWKGSNAIDVKVSEPATKTGSSEDSVVCYPAKNRVTPQVSFNPGVITPKTEPVAIQDETPLLRDISSEPAKKSFEPRVQGTQGPESLGKTLSPEKPKPNPSSLLPPFE